MTTNRRWHSPGRERLRREAYDGIRVRTAGAVLMPDTVNFLQHLSRALAENGGFSRGETLIARRPVTAPEFGRLPPEWFE
jgi:hypothetical protein